MEIFQLLFDILIMKYCISIIVLIYVIICLVICTRRRRKSDNTKLIQRTGQAIANDDLIAKYESEHQKLYEEGNKENGYLEWQASTYKNLSIYCRKYLQHVIPTRKACNVIGGQIIKTLHYVKQNINIITKIVIVRCTVMNHVPLCYYITMAPKSDCVYALRSMGHGDLTFTIINKYCDFEDNPLINMSNKWKRKEIEVIYHMHLRTGQPVAKDEYLLKYELEHQKMVYKEGKEAEHIEWPPEIVLCHLDQYCFQYMRECAPSRYQEGIRGTMKHEKLRYQKLNVNRDVDVITVMCVTSNASHWYYYMTKAPEINCVYALLRQGCNRYSPLVIIFKHCNFENTMEKQTILQYCKNTIPKIEMKEKLFDEEVTLQLFQKE